MGWIRLCLLFGLAACGSVSDPGASNGTNGGESCSSSAECPMDAPICGDEGVCTGCTSSAQCEGTSGGPICSSSGQCVFCESDNDCGDVNRPVCDEDFGFCRGCEQHAECPSDMCEPQTHSCVAEDDVLYVDHRGSDEPPCTKESPCASVVTAQTQMVDSQRFIRILPTGDEPYGESFRFGEIGDEIDGPIVVNAEGAVFDWTEQEGGIEVEAETGVIIEGGEFRNANQAAFECFAGGGEGRGLTLRNVLMLNNLRGVETRAGNCEVEIYSSQFTGNFDYGVVMSNGVATIERSLFFDNLRGAIDLRDVIFTIRNNLFLENSRGGDPAPVVFVDSINGVPVPSRFLHNTVFDNLIISAPPIPVMDCQQHQGDIAVVGNILFNNRNSFPTRGCGEEDNPPISGMRIIAGNILEPAEGYNMPDGNITQAPMFEDPPNEDFSLREGSPGIDDADILWAPGDDFLGQTRSFISPFPDIGAIESQ